MVENVVMVRIGTRDRENVASIALIEIFFGLQSEESEERNIPRLGVEASQALGSGGWT